MEKAGNAYIFYQSIDPKRVKVMQALANAMMAFPSLRLCQLINNVRGTDPELKTYQDEFYIRDNDLAEAIERYVLKHHQMTHLSMPEVGPENYAGLPLEATEKNFEPWNPQPKHDPITPPRPGKSSDPAFVDRARTYTMTNEDWQLYSTTDPQELQHAIDQLNLAVAQARSLYENWEEARDFVYEVMDHFEGLGARDTEPEVNLAYALEVLYQAETHR